MRQSSVALDTPVMSPWLPDNDRWACPSARATVNPGSIRLARPEQGQTADQLLWTLIRNRTNAISLQQLLQLHQHRAV